MTARMSSLQQRADRILGLQVEAHVHLDAADRGEVVALRIEEQAVEQRLCGVQRRRLARAHDPVDVHQRFLVVGVLVDVERVADEGADRDMVDVEDREILDLRFLQRLQQLGVELLAGLAVDLARLQIDDVLGQIPAGQVLGVEQHLLEAFLGQLAGALGRHLLAGLGDHLARLGIDEIGRRRHAAHLLRNERHLPAALALLDGDGLVEARQDLLVIHAQRVEQRGHRQLAAPVDAHVDDVLGVELEVEPGAAIGDDAGGEQQLARGMRAAPVVVEEHAGRAVHLADDDALGAVDDEGAVGRHERHVAHVDVLLLHVLDGLGAGLLVHIEHDEAQLHLQRRRKRHVALLALVDVVLRRLEVVALEVERRPAGEIRDRKHRLEDRLQSLLRPAARGLLDHQKVVIGALLHLDEVRHLGHFADRAELLPDALAAVVGFNHFRSSSFVRRRKMLILPPTGLGAPRHCLRSFQRSSTQSLPFHCPVGRSDAGAEALPAPHRAGRPCIYLTSTTAPWSSSCFLSLAASSLLTPSLTVLPPASTRSLASLRPRPGDGAHLLDDVDLLLAARLEDDGELGLLLDGRRRTCRGARRDGHCCGSRNAPLRLQQLGELRRLQNGQLRKVVDDFCQDRP